jgi:hypothetical protein
VLNVPGPYFRNEEVLLAPQKTEDYKDKHDNDQNMHGGSSTFGVSKAVLEPFFMNRTAT